LKPEEWWDGYVARVLADNGHAPTREYMLEKLEPVVAQLVSDDVKRHAMAGDLIAETLRTYSGWTLPAWAVRGTKSAAAYCPICFSDVPYVRLSWRLRAVTHCAVHERSLQTRCSVCGRAVFHWDLARQVCCCGAALALSHPATSRATDVLTAEEGPTDRSNWRLSSQDALNATTDLRCSSASVFPDTLAVMVLLGALLPALVDVRVTGLADEARTTSGFLKVLFLKLAPSKRWVEELLEALPSAAHLRAALNVILELNKDEKTARSILSSLPLREWAEQLCALGASPASAERRGLIPGGAMRQGLVPLKVAARQAGLTDMHLHQLMSRGAVVPARTLKVGERQHLFSSDQVHALERFCHQGYGYGRSLDLGLEVSNVYVLRNTGILSLVPGSDRKTWLDGNELRVLLAALAERANQLESVDGLKLNLGSRRIWQPRYIPGLKALFAKFRSGEIPLWTFGDRPGFARFHVGVEALEFLHRSVGARAMAVDNESQPRLPLTGGRTAWEATAAPRTRCMFFQPPHRALDAWPQLSLALG